MPRQGHAAAASNNAPSSQPLSHASCALLHLNSLQDGGQSLPQWRGERCLSDWFAEIRSLLIPAKQTALQGAINSQYSLQTKPCNVPTALALTSHINSLLLSSQTHRHTHTYTLLQHGRHVCFQSSHPTLPKNHIPLLI